MDANIENHNMLEVHKLCKAYGQGNARLEVLREVSFAVRAGETLAITGPSGSGKTTLLGLCAGLDSPSSGSVLLGGVDLEDLGEDGRAALRNRKVGFVFQNFQLIPTLTALENVKVPLELSGQAGADARARELLGEVGLGARMNHYPVQLSGGEQQRVALARAFVNRPAILFADEPTGNLDHETSEHVVGLLFDLNRRAGTTLVLVTHDNDLAARLDRTLPMYDGRVRQGFETLLSKEQ